MKMQHSTTKLQDNLVLKCNPDNIQSPVALRLVKFATFKNLSIREFERSIGANQGWIHSMRSSVTIPKLKQILKVYPDLSVRYVYLGDCNMIENAAQTVEGQDGQKMVVVPASEHDEVERLTEVVKMQAEKLALLEETNAKLADALHVVLKDASVVGVTVAKSSPNE